MENGPQQINLQEIIRKRVPAKKRRFLPRFLVKIMERIICQDELNRILKYAFPHKGHAFASKALEYLHIRVTVRGLEKLPPDGRYIFASNHPLGGLDGIALISVLGAKYGDEHLRLPVNDMLMNVEPLRGVFIPINKFGRQGREAARQLQEAYASDAQIVFFPAGLVSRLQKGGKIADLEWQKAFVAKAIEYGRDIVPVHFSGENTKRFYNVARWRKRLGLKFNFEQILLPSEVCKSRHAEYTITFGDPISTKQLKESPFSHKEIAETIRKVAYTLSQS